MDWTDPLKRPERFTEEVWERAFDEADEFSDLYGCDEGKRLRLITAFAEVSVVGMSVASKAEFDVFAERRRQINDEGFVQKRDDTLTRLELPRAAYCYVWGSMMVEELQIPDGFRPWDWFRFREPLGTMWPFRSIWWKPGSARRMLIKAAALLIAEIERIDRATAKAGGAS